MGAIVTLIPIVFMFSGSFKFSHELLNINIIPEDPTWQNYLLVIEESQFLQWFINSLVIATTVTLSVLFFDSLVGYVLCKFRFHGRKLVFLAILSTLMIPTEMLVLPWYSMSVTLGWTDTYWGIMFPGLITGFGVFLMRQFFQTVPDEFIEAARIDGLGEFHIWWSIAMPLVAPALSALAIFTFLGNWAAFLWPLIVATDTALYTIPVGIASVNGEFLSQWELMMAGSALATFPGLIVFIVLQKYIVRGVMLAGLKG